MYNAESETGVHDWAQIYNTTVGDELIRIVTARR